MIKPEIRRILEIVNRLDISEELEEKLSLQN